MVESRLAPAPGAIRRALAARAPAQAAECIDDVQRLCLAGRFLVSVSWAGSDGGEGVGAARRLTSDTGTFAFFDSANLELMVKALDGSAINGAFWFFYASLSDVGFEITVLDTATGLIRSYRNPPGSFASMGDTAAFPGL
jgi:hypothetical protein